MLRTFNWPVVHATAILSSDDKLFIILICEVSNWYRWLSGLWRTKLRTLRTGRPVRSLARKSDFVHGRQDGECVVRWNSVDELFVIHQLILFNLYHLLSKAWVITLMGVCLIWRIAQYDSTYLCCRKNIKKWKVSLLHQHLRTASPSCHSLVPTWALNHQAASKEGVKPPQLAGSTDPLRAF